MSTTTETAQNDTTLPMMQHVKREALNPLLTAFVVTGRYYDLFLLLFECPRRNRLLLLIFFFLSLFESTADCFRRNSLRPHHPRKWAPMCLSPQRQKTLVPSEFKNNYSENNQK